MMHARRAPLLALLLALLAAGTPALGQPADAVRAFELGNAQYAEGDFAGALTAYERALETGYVSGALFYNMGNAYYRIDEIGRAILYYERARRLLPERPELLHNLEMAQARTADRFATLPPPVWTRAWNGVVRSVGAWGLFAAGLALYLLALGLAGYRIHTGRRNPWHRRVLTLSLLTGLFLLAGAFAASLDARLDRTAVVLADDVPLRTAPALDAAATLDVHEGAVLDVVRDAGPWLEVRLPNGTQGWLAADAVAEV